MRLYVIFWPRVPLYDAGISGFLLRRWWGSKVTFGEQSKSRPDSPF